MHAIGYYEGTMKVGFDSVMAQEARQSTYTCDPAPGTLATDFRLSKKKFQGRIVEFSLRQCDIL